MPNSETFNVPCIRDFVGKYLIGAKVIVDPFARNSEFGTHRNDLNKETKAEFHLEANEFLLLMQSKGVLADVVIFDPPYSPRQVMECYNGIGMVVTQKDTQTPQTEWKNNIAKICKDGTVVLSFGWNSTGMGEKHGFRIEEIMLVAHGGNHNDTICMAEKKIGLF
jgi:hypothetical protein